MDRAKLQEQLHALNVTNIKVFDKPYGANFNYPGLSPESYDTFGNPKLKSVLYNAISSRYYMFNEPYNEHGDIFLDWPTLTADRLTFVASAEVTFSRDLYKSCVGKDRFDISLRLGTVGNASMSIVTELRSPNTETTGWTPEDPPLVSFVTQSISINKAIRKSLPWPDWFKEKYTARGCRSEGLVVRPFPRPWNTASCPLIVRYSDTDFNLHTNFTSYMTFAEDAVHAAISRGASQLHGFGVEDFSKGIKNVKISYQNESHEGDKLTTYVWHLPDEPSLVRCSIEKKGTVVCQLAQQYFV